MKGHMRERGPDTYSIVIELGRGSDGKRHQKWHTFHGGKREAQVEMARLVTEAKKSGSKAEPSKITVAEYMDKWVERHGTLQLAPKTYERYKSIIDLYIKPHLGSYRLRDLKRSHIQDFYTQVMKSGRKDNKEGGLSPRTVVQFHRILHLALKQAFDDGDIPTNPCKGLKIQWQQKEMQVLNATQVEQLLERVKGTRVYMPTLLAVDTGLRRGEVLALRWKDVNLKAGTITVRHSLEQIGQTVRLKEPKNKRPRTIRLLQRTINALRLHQKEQDEEKRLFAEDYQDNGFVCTGLAGVPLMPDDISGDFRDMVTRSKLPRIRFHDLRHTHATILLALGVSPKVVSTRLGHTTTSITMNVYAHMLPEMEEEAMSKLEEAFPPKEDNDEETKPDD